MSFGLITKTPLSLSTEKIRAQICEQKNIAISNFDIQYILLQKLVKNTTTHTHEWFYENQNKMEAFYRPAVSPFQLPPLSTIYPPLSKPPSNLSQRSWHIIETIVVESLTLSLKSSLLNHPLPPFQAPENLVTFARKLATFSL